MTNLGRLQQMDAGSLAYEFQMYTKSSARPYFDMLEWLLSEQEEYPIRGEDALYKGEPCIVVEKLDRFGSPYKTALIKKGLHEFQLISSPAENFK